MSSTQVVASRGASHQYASRFLCPSPTWEFLRALGQTFGWHPRGTTYVTSARQRTPPLASLRHNYQPGGVQDYKRVEAADAVAWAAALAIARQTSFFHGMLRTHAALLGTPWEPLLETLDQFVVFAQGGEFVFALCVRPEDRLEFESVTAARSCRDRVTN